MAQPVLLSLRGMLGFMLASTQRRWLALAAMVPTCTGRSHSPAHCLPERPPLSGENVAGQGRRCQPGQTGAWHVTPTLAHMSTYNECGLRLFPENAWANCAIFGVGEAGSTPCMTAPSDPACVTVETETQHVAGPACCHAPGS